MGDMSGCLATDIMCYCFCCCLNRVFGSSGLNCETKVKKQHREVFTLYIMLFGHNVFHQTQKGRYGMGGVVWGEREEEGGGGQNGRNQGATRLSCLKLLVWVFLFELSIPSLSSWLFMWCLWCPPIFIFVRMLPHKTFRCFLSPATVCWIKDARVRVNRTLTLTLTVRQILQTKV